VGNAGENLRFHECLEFDLAFDRFHDVFDVAAILLLLEFLGLFQHELVKAGARKLSSMFAGLLLRLQERLIELLHFFGLAFRFGARHAKCLRLGGLLFGFFFQARGLDLFRRRAKVPLNFSFFFQHHLFPKDIFVLRVGLRKIIEAESLRELQLAAALRVALHELIDAPFNFRRRALPATAEILVVFDLELADVPFELAQIFVDGRHAWRNPPCHHARSTDEWRQPDERAAMRIRHHAGPHLLSCPREQAIAIARYSALC
jgi:hypothetical protein